MVITFRCRLSVYLGSAADPSSLANRSVVSTPTNLRNTGTRPTPFRRKVAADGGRWSWRPSHDGQDSAAFEHDVSQIGPVAAAFTAEMWRISVSEVEAGPVKTGSYEAGPGGTEADIDQMQPGRGSKNLRLLTQSTHPRMAETPLAGQMTFFIINGNTSKDAIIVSANTGLFVIILAGISGQRLLSS